MNYYWPYRFILLCKSSSNTFHYCTNLSGTSRYLRRGEKNGIFLTFKCYSAVRTPVGLCDETVLWHSSWIPLASVKANCVFSWKLNSWKVSCWRRFLLFNEHLINPRVWKAMGPLDYWSGWIVCVCSVCVCCERRFREGWDNGKQSTIIWGRAQYTLLAIISICSQ